MAASTVGINSMNPQNIQNFFQIEGKYDGEQSLFFIIYFMLWG